MTEFTAPSGATIIINPAPWKDAKALKMAISREAAIRGMNFDNVDNSLFTLFFQLQGSQDVDNALAACLVRCTRNNEKITDNTFDNVEARADYHEIVKSCLKENLSPLVASLFSEFKNLALLKKQEKNIPA